MNDLPNRYLIVCFYVFRKQKYWELIPLGNEITQWQVSITQKGYNAINTQGDLMS
jgi:hypothetical protein